MPTVPPTPLQNETYACDTCHPPRSVLFFHLKMPPLPLNPAHLPCAWTSISLVTSTRILLDFKTEAKRNWDLPWLAPQSELETEGRTRGDQQTTAHSSTPSYCEKGMGAPVPCLELTEDGDTLRPGCTPASPQHSPTLDFGLSPLPSH